jgi:mRNA interferase HicA
MALPRFALSQCKHFCLQYGRPVKQSEFRRWLARQGATFIEGSRHTKIYLNGRQSVMPRHPGTELGENLRRLIIKQLGME